MGMTPGPVLGFDTSGPHCAVAIVAAGRVMHHAVEDMTKGQAERLMPLIAETLTAAGVDYADLAAIGVGTGPGNFTGTRIAVAAARGLALGLDIPAEGVTSAEAYAGGNAEVVVCLPAPRGAVLLARGTEFIPHAPPDPLPEAWSGPVTGPAAEVIAEQTGATILPHPEIATSIALIAANRAAPHRPRPAPVYLRPADAAPARDLPPVIL